jgi:hypothetical protein
MGKVTLKLTLTYGHHDYTFSLWRPANFGYLYFTGPMPPDSAHDPIRFVNTMQLRSQCGIVHPTKWTLAARKNSTSSTCSSL